MSSLPGLDVMDFSTDAILAAMERAERELVESSTVIMCRHETKTTILESDEYQKMGRVYFICNEACEPYKAYVITEPGLKREYIKLVQQQQAMEGNND